MNDGFYRAFEERYYAPREVIKELRKQYLPFTHHLAIIYPGSPTFDAGCGRGEWLELMIEQGFLPTGLDLDDGMLTACIELQLPAQKGDAFKHINTFTNESQSIVSAFHVVEHISFEQLRAFVKQALRVLKPGGLLIMETPNPENIIVSTRNFYLDPTHQRLIPPQLLAFVTEYEGFERVKTIRLQEPKDISSRENIGFTEVINCVSPDYAVIAQKKAPLSLLSKSQELFDVEYGVNLDTLSIKLDQRLTHIEAQSMQVNKSARQAEAKAEQAEAKAKQAEAKAKQAEAKAEQAEAKAEQAEAKAEQSQALIRSLVKSLQRIKILFGDKTTTLLRGLYRWRLFSQYGFKERIKVLAKKILKKLVPFVVARPTLWTLAVQFGHRLGVTDRLKPFVRTCLLGQSLVTEYESAVKMPISQMNELTNLSLRAKQIYADLKTAVEEQKKI